jgi:carboxypeptidase C (cathepsin A)
MDTLGIGNGIIDELIQVAFYPDFAVNNTYGIKAVDDITYLAMKTAYSQPGGCKDQATACAAADRSTTEGQWICSNATNFCRSNVEGPYYATNHGAYDIRQPADDPTPPQNFIDYLNTAPIQQALGVNLNYTSDASDTVSEGFQETGDFSYPDFKVDLEHLLNEGVRVALYYGDADYICNWFGGEAISLAVNWTHADQFRAAGYTPFMVDGTEYGQVRQVGNYSFLRIYESGHEVPYYQPKASLEFFRRVLGHVDVALGTTPVTAGYVTNGTANSTYSEASGTSSGAATPTQSGAAKPTSSKSAGTRRIARPFWW